MRPHVPALLLLAACSKTDPAPAPAASAAPTPSEEARSTDKTRAIGLDFMPASFELLWF